MQIETICRHILGSGTAKTGRHARRSTLAAGRSTGRSRKGVPFLPYGRDIRYGAVVELGYARVSTMKQDLDRQIDALEQPGQVRRRGLRPGARRPPRARVGRNGWRLLRQRARRIVRRQLQDRADRRPLGALMSVVNIAIWMLVGGLWFKVLGYW